MKFVVCVISRDFPTGTQSVICSMIILTFSLLLEILQNVLHYNMFNKLGGFPMKFVVCVISRDFPWPHRRIDRRASMLINVVNVG